MRAERKMEVKIYKPKSRLLEQYIECFYILKRESAEPEVTYYAFPSFFPTVGLNVNATHKPTGLSNFTVSHCPINKLATSLICQFENYGWIKYEEGPADEIVIYFKPLGLNAFLENALRHYVHSFIGDFQPFDDYRARMIDLFNIDKAVDRIQSLENYWLSKYKGFRHPFLHNVVEEIMTDEGSSSISETALKNGISRTTLIKHFDLHLCMTPSQFKKIVRFRSAMKRYRQKTTDESLTDISHGVEYFDQSHMIKDFKSLTKYPPKTFFSKISTFEDGYINWLFL
jgi:AraC-like DNA-binding protein